MPLTYAQLSSFITNYIRGEDLGPTDYVTGSTLIRLCQHAFCDEEDASQLEYAADRDAIVKCIRRMKMEGVLRMFHLREGKGFALAESSEQAGSGRDEMESPPVQLSYMVEDGDSRGESDDAPETTTADTSLQEDEQEAIERAEEIRKTTSPYFDLYTTESYSYTPQ